MFIRNWEINYERNWKGIETKMNGKELIWENLGKEWEGARKELRKN